MSARRGASALERRNSAPASNCCCRFFFRLLPDDAPKCPKLPFSNSVTDLSNGLFYLLIATATTLCSSPWSSARAAGFAFVGSRAQRNERATTAAIAAAVLFVVPIGLELDERAANGCRDRSRSDRLARASVAARPDARSASGRRILVSYLCREGPVDGPARARRRNPALPSLFVRRATPLRN